MTLLQLLNLIVWIIHCETNLFHYEAVEYVMMVYAGLLGGAMYVNCAFSILTDKGISDKDRELCMNMMAIAVNLGITVSAVVEVVADGTVFADLVNKSVSSGDGKT